LFTLLPLTWLVLSYRLIPIGSFSRIEKTTGDKASYELYGSGDLHFGRLLHNRRFDIAMVGFLDCLKHLMDHIKTQDPSVDFPHQYVAVPDRLWTGIADGRT
jgi:beclin 1